MKKVIILLTLLLAVAPVFATPDIIMNAVIDPNGSSITDPDDNVDVDPIIKGPVNVYLFYSTKALEGAVLNITDIVTDMKPIEDTNIEEGGFDLTGDDKEDNDALYLYLYAGYNTDSDATATVTFSSTGWKYGGEGDAVTPLIFTSQVSSPANGLTCQSSDTRASGDNSEASAEFTFAATKGTQYLESFLAGISTVTWEQNSGYLAGSYQATITIEVTPAQA